MERDSFPLQHEYETLKKSLESNQQKKEKVLGLYEADLIQKADLVQRLSTLNEVKERIEERLSPIELQMGQGGTQLINFSMVKQVMQNFKSAYQESLTREQRKRLMHLLIRQITINEDRKIDTIQIQLNKEVAKHSPFFYFNRPKEQIT
ncbi:hypothetical protein [Bacillus safensis]|uniref:hypothetical protein n=1 Tax=Bacillus safensis TaxID=561879 RepID=UPI002FFE2D52